MTLLFIVITLLALIFGAILGFASLKLKVEADPIVEKIDSILPQSQCGQCGYPGCKPYAEAICNGDDITKCIQACPVDAIIGTNKFMHTIIPDLCTGCELCVAPCPTDCISMIPVKKNIDNWDWKFDAKLVIPVMNVNGTEKKLVVGE